MMQIKDEILNVERITAMSEELMGFTDNEILNPKTSSTTTNIVVEILYRHRDIFSTCNWDKNDTLCTYIFVNIIMFK